MLVAGTALSLIAPVASQASETVNLEEMNNYVRSEKSSRIDSNTFLNDVKEDLAKVNSRVDGLEARQNNFEAGAFSDTTTMDGKAVFSVGALDSPEGESTLIDSTIFQYMYVMNLNTSFSGDDNLYVRIKTGNAQDKKQFAEKNFGTYLSSTNTKGDTLTVDKMWYSMPLGDKVTFTAGPKIENYYMHGTTPSIYKPVLKQFTLGGNAAAYGASTSPGAGLTWTGDNGLAISTNFTTQDGHKHGLLVDGGLDNTTVLGETSWATQIGYTQPRYSVSAIINQKYNGWVDSYFSTATGKARGGDGSSTNIGLRGWWRPAETGTATPSISVGFDTSTIDATSNDSTNMYFVGLQWQDMFSADDRIGLAVGQPQKNESETVDPFAWEAYYSFQVNDSVNVTPAVFGGSNRNGSADGDITGVVLETTFKF